MTSSTIGPVHEPLRATASVPAAAKTGNRDPAIDFTKGALVVLMFVYHSVNYFCQDKNPLRYLHFLPASFIFITGFLLIRVQQPKLSRGVRHVRLHVAVRGLKLFALFAGLNVLAHVLFTSNYNNPSFGLETLWLSAPDILLVGGQGAAVFDVLLPISYLLILSSAVIVASERRQRWVITVAAGTSVLGSLVLEMIEFPIYNGGMLSMGLLGMLAGVLPTRHIAAAARWLFTLMAANIGYGLLAGIRYPGYAMNILGVCLALLGLLAIGRKAPSAVIGYRWLTLLGRYSLLGYIAQIAVLQSLYRLARYLDLPHSFSAALVVTTLATTLIVLIADWSRSRSRVFDTAYRFVLA